MTLKEKRQTIQEALKSSMKPCLVTAPLRVDAIDNVDTNTIYIFDYKNSFVDDETKESSMITYVESLGCMCDIMIPADTSYKEKENLLLEYFHSSSFFNVYSLIQTMIHILFTYKEIKYTGSASIFSEEEVKLFLDRNKMFIKELITFYNSIFLMMLMYSSSIDRTIKDIRKRYGKDRIKDDELSPNLCSLLMDRMFYTYYEKHIGKDLYYYSFLFDNNLYKGKSFLSVLTNSNNVLLPVMIDMNNPKFLNFMNEKCEKMV